MPDWLDRQKCSAITPSTSDNTCLFHQRKWRAHLDSIRPLTGIPKGVRISVGGNMRIGSELGGSMSIEYETEKLRAGEAFIVFIDSVEVLKVTGGVEKITNEKSFALAKGDHLIQFSVESRLEPDLIASFWDIEEYQKV